MDIIEHVDEKGRKYKAYSMGEGPVIIIGPAQGLVDSLGLPEEIATRLHNVLYARGLINLASVARTPNALTGALQEVLGLDAQKLHEAYFKFGHEEVTHG